MGITRPVSEAGGIHLILVALASQLSSCDTMSRYRATSDTFSIRDTPSEEMSSRQDVINDVENIELALYVNRFNFSMNVYLEIRNSSKTMLDYQVKNVSLTVTKTGTVLQLKEAGELITAKKYREFEGTEPKIQIEPASVRQIIYRFDGASAMKFSHILKSEEQKKLALNIRGLSKNSKKIPMNIELTER